MKKAPIIGVIPALNEELKIILQREYTDSIIAEGGIPYIIPYVTDRDAARRVTEYCDGFLFTGGVDVDPALYGETVMPECGAIQRERDDFELLLSEVILRDKRPVMGICRGCQLVNVALGGTLYQDIGTAIGDEISHRQSPPFTVPTHKVKILEDTELFSILKKEEIWVNSIHHQAIKTLGEGLRAAAVAPDGVTEAAFSEGEKYISLLQWHPERTYNTDDESKALFRRFIEAAGGIKNE